MDSISITISELKSVCKSAHLSIPEYVTLAIHLTLLASLSVTKKVVIKAVISYDSRRKAAKPGRMIIMGEDIWNRIEFDFDII